jgi:hypothetical protein
MRGETVDAPFFIEFDAFRRYGGVVGILSDVQFSIEVIHDSIWMGYYEVMKSNFEFRLSTLFGVRLSKLGGD